MKNLFKNLLLLLFVTIIVLLVAEGIFRLTRKADALEISTGKMNSKYHHALEPNSELRMASSVSGEFDVTAHINNFGFRGPQMDEAKKPGQKRIFIVGDSFTFGVGAKDNETIPFLLQQKLDPTREKIEIVNDGHGHYSPLIYYLRFRDEIQKFKPDMVIMMLDFSDIWDDWHFERMAVRDAAGDIIAVNPYYENGKFNLWNYLRANSVMCKYLHNKMVRTVLKIQKLGLKNYLKAKIEGKRAKAVIATGGEESIDQDGKIFLRGSLKAAEIKKHFPRTAKYILMCRDLTNANGAQFILVMYPYGIQVGPNQWNEGRVFWGFEKGKLYDDLFSFNLVENFAKENGIPFIKILNELRAHADEKLYFDYDGHLTPRGNEIVAETLVSALVYESLGSAQK
ncbi:MAG: hypothetical protein A3G33_03080 [Omnitrophica bacterium RIFCSPLOWO2_12_FULL_44_17]|uniref:AlgX/AlgJ SGNH hydrolase-like domain-containing protein n=1 Tax=Candidatus Danuiimicrobium aquiferis TaxID=1801832 RepID=A0A1G1KQU7_9BACT|nr:MAG: hypothetical protein A3E74_04415 [Omnitrophica bacterium RIFCSPHIGHO2_12_FULL_44_12]OGW95320.1 MAG: hypothetical protein A3G33_03080 [Omnitrophica bacterium RIFCSPLOWO2_12_FULL_44_17]OGX04723.1 MAG: hypothetical protein A3J12_09110 [Omnitrophica bacterium RIFCSPLOWO2_02_FULL_44_11]